MIMRMITFPFRVIGGLVVLGIAYLLFALGFILLVAFLRTPSPFHPIDAQGVVVQIRAYCVAETYDGRTRSTRASGFCEQYENQLRSNPSSYDGHPWTREPYLHVKYRDEEGRERSRHARASELGIPPDAKVGDRVLFKAQTRKRNWQQWCSDWYASMPILGLMVGSLSASAVLWTWGGGWRIMSRQHRREQRAVMAKIKIAGLAMAFVAWLINWVRRRIEHVRLARATTRLRGDRTRN